MSLSFLAKAKLWKLLMGLKKFELLETVYKRNWQFCWKKIQEKHENHWMTIKKTLKPITGHTSETFHTMIIEKKQESNGITISCFFVWRFMVHGMICMSCQPALHINRFAKQTNLVPFGWQTKSVLTFLWIFRVRVYKSTLKLLM